MEQQGNILHGTTSCVHHWLIASPTGKQSLGVCKFCGEQRMFNNTIENWPTVWKQPKEKQEENEENEENYD